MLDCTGIIKVTVELPPPDRDLWSESFDIISWLNEWAEKFLEEFIRPQVGNVALLPYLR
jgi:hypothetical protein